MKQLIEASEQYLKVLSETTEETLQPFIKALNEDIKYLISKAGALIPKKKHIVCGSFNLTRRMDLLPDQIIKFSVFARQFEYFTSKDILEFVKYFLAYQGINVRDILYLEGKTDLTADSIKFDFIFESDTIYPNSDIGVVLPSGALNVFGYVQANKINLEYISGKDIDPELFNRPLKGFRIPYNQSLNNVYAIVSLLTDNIIDNGETADFRALTAFSKIEKDTLIELYKSKKWARIIMPGELYYLRAGKYIKA